MKSKTNKPGAGKANQSDPSPGGIQRYISAERSMSQEGLSSPWQVVPARPGVGRQKPAAEETAAVQTNVSSAKKHWGKPFGRPKTTKWGSKKRDSALSMKDKVGLEQAQTGVPLTKKALAKMLTKMEIQYH